MRLVFAGIARYDELMHVWDLDEVLEAHEILDLKAEHQPKVPA